MSLTFNVTTEPSPEEWLEDIIDPLLAGKLDKDALAVTTLLQGAAANPARIGQEYIPEIVDSVLQLSNPGPGVVLPAGSVTGGPDPTLIYLHDNVAPNGNAYQPLPLNSRFGHVRAPLYRIKGETLTDICAGTITTSGSLSVSLVSAATGTVSLTVAVAAGDLPWQVCKKLVAALGANTTIAAGFDVRAIGNAFVIQSKSTTATDNTRSISVTGSALGFTNIATGTNTGTTAWTKLCDFDLEAADVAVGRSFTLDMDINALVPGSQANAAYSLVLVPEAMQGNVFSTTGGFARYDFTSNTTGSNYLDSSLRGLFPITIKANATYGVFTGAAADGLMLPNVAEVVKGVPSDGIYPVSMSITRSFTAGNLTSRFNLGKSMKVGLYLTNGIDTAYSGPGGPYLSFKTIFRKGLSL